MINKNIQGIVYIPTQIIKDELKGAVKEIDLSKAGKFYPLFKDTETFFKDLVARVQDFLNCKETLDSDHHTLGPMNLLGLKLTSENKDKLLAAGIRLILTSAGMYYFSFIDLYDKFLLSIDFWKKSKLKANKKPKPQKEVNEIKIEAVQEVKVLPVLEKNDDPALKELQDLRDELFKKTKTAVKDKIPENILREWNQQKRILKEFIDKYNNKSKDTYFNIKIQLLIDQLKSIKSRIDQPAQKSTVPKTKRGKKLKAAKPAKATAPKKETNQSQTKPVGEGELPDKVYEAIRSQSPVFQPSARNKSRFAFAQDDHKSTDENQNKGIDFRC